MKILLVNPPRYSGLPVIREDRCEIINRYMVNPPYSLIQIASVIREKSQEVQVIDANCENLSYSEVQKKIKENKPHIVVFRFTPKTINADMETAKITKSLYPNALTIGICWTLKRFAEKIIIDNKDLDVYLSGEYGTYEKIFLNLIEAMNKRLPLDTVKGIVFRRDGNAVSTGPCTTDYPYEVPIPAYDLLPPLSKYYISPKHSRHSPFTIMYTSMGCPYSCIFCVMRQTKWRKRSVESIRKEITYLKNEHGLKCVFFMDELFTMDRQRTVDLCKAFIENKIDLTWYTSTRINMVDEDLLEIMRRAGCRSISFGIESGSQKILDYAKKDVKVEQAMEAVKMVKDAGIGVHLSFIIGLPGENWKTFKKTLDFVKKTLPSMAQFNVAVPYPGTPLYDLARSKGWIDEDLDYTQLQHQASIMRTEEMTTEEIEEARKKAYRSLYYNPRWILSQLSNFENLSLTTRYYLKCLKMYLLHGMKHSH
ncbi:MAG: B12-binding domain-containing radical SAM protein [Candidatus Hodarchaeota archaeon]